MPSVYKDGKRYDSPPPCENPNCPACRSKSIKDDKQLEILYPKDEPRRETLTSEVYDHQEEDEQSQPNV